MTLNDGFRSYPVALFRHIAKAVIRNLRSPISGCKHLHLPSGGRGKQCLVAGCQ